MIANDVRRQVATVYINNFVALKIELNFSVKNITFIIFKVVQAVSINVEKNAFSTLVVLIDVIRNVSESFLGCRLRRLSLCKELC